MSAKTPQEPGSGPSAEEPLPTFAEILAAHHPTACDARVECLAEIYGNGWPKHMENVLAVAAEHGIHPARQEFTEDNRPNLPAARRPIRFRGGRSTPKTPKDTQ